MITDKSIKKLNSKPIIHVSEIGKFYKIYQSPKDKLKEISLLGKRHFHKKFWALKNISFDVFQGDCIGIIGKNGSGKSTLLQIICNTLHPNSGIVEINGRVAALLELGAGFNPEFTGKENVYLNASILGLSNKEIDDKFLQIVQFADIGEFIDQPVKIYSSGMYVRLAFSVAINVEPDILVIDEALSVGDILFQAKCYDKLDQLIEKNITILFVSHDLRAVKRLCNRVIYLEKGEIKKIGTPLQTIEQYYLDTRAEQQKRLSGYLPIKLKATIENKNNMAFGTDQGKVLRTEFIGESSNISTVSPEDHVQVLIDVEFQTKIKRPALSLIIQDQKSLDIGGTYVFLPSDHSNKNLCRSRIIFSFKPKLIAGVYLITIRLEDRVSEKKFFPIDKQVGALILRVLPYKDKRLLGLFDLEIKYHQKEFGQNLEFKNKRHQIT